MLTPFLDKLTEQKETYVRSMYKNATVHPINSMNAFFVKER